MPFSYSTRQEALWRSRRCCVLCKGFAGRDINVHHIEPEGDGGPNTLENAATLCTRCHGEVEHYNPNHPVGTKWRRDEIVKYRDEWWEACANDPPGSLPRAGVAVSPVRTRFSAIDYAPRATIRVSNTSAVPVYSVGVQLTVASGDLDAQHLRIAPLAYEHTETAELGGASLGLDVLAFFGHDDSERSVAYIDFRHINPMTTIALGVEYVGEGPSEPSALDAMVAGFEEETLRPLLERKREVLRPFKTWSSLEVNQALAFFQGADEPLTLRLQIASADDIEQPDSWVDIRTRWGAVRPR